MATSSSNAPNPSAIFDTLNAYQRTGALRAAIELDVFTAIGEGADSASAVAQRRNASERGVRILCDCLTVMGFLEKRDSKYQLTADSAIFLDQRSPAYLGTVARFLGAPEMLGMYNDVVGLVRRGGTLAGQGTVAPDHPVWVEFARSMAPMMRVPSQLLAEMAGTGIAKVLDIACGHGLYGIAVARRNPAAHIFGSDWAPVLEVAKENAAKEGIGERYHTIAGSSFDADFGTDYDLALLTNFLHHFNVAQCEQLLKKIHAALKPDGRVLTLEFVPNEDRVSPPTHAMFALMMLGSTPEGDAYTFSEYERMFARAGFSRCELTDLGPFQRVIISYR